jgi:hypothetical protein
VLLAALLCCSAFGQAVKPNFSGTWKLNNGKSDPHGSPDHPYINVIEQNGKTITVTTKAEGVTNILDDTFPINNKPRIVKMDKTYRYTTVLWEGNTLVFEILDKDGKKELSKVLMGIRESWTLSPDGKVITKFRRTGTATGEGKNKVVDEKYVLDKQ